MASQISLVWPLVIKQVKRSEQGGIVGQQGVLWPASKQTLSPSAVISLSATKPYSNGALAKEQ